VGVKARRQLFQLKTWLPSTIRTVKEIIPQETSHRRMKMTVLLQWLPIVEGHHIAFIYLESWDMNGMGKIEREKYKRRWHHIESLMPFIYLVSHGQDESNKDQ